MTTMSLKLFKHIIDNPVEHPYIVELKKRQLLYGGAVIPPKVCLEILDCEYRPQDWAFVGKYLTLKGELESRHYMITQRDIEKPGFRILRTEEMAEEATRKIHKAMCTNYKMSYIMANHDISMLSERDKKIYNAVKQKAAMVAMMQQKILFDEFTLD